MSGNQASDLPTRGEVDDITIADYLREHPDFFQRHGELLAELSIPHAAGGAVSLVERLVDALRAENSDLKGRLQDLVTLARDNDQLNQRLHHLTLGLLDAADFDEVLTVLEDQLHDEFRADAVEMRLFSATEVRSEAQGGTVNDPELAAFVDFFDRGQPVCGPLSPEQLGFLFGGEADDLGSAALMPLRGDDIMGVLAVGSSDPERFRPDMGTEFLRRLSEVVSRKLQAVSLPGV
jgi:uncharacterized protein YigA (DUF484 family)